jgi:hypothetical protein
MENEHDQPNPTLLKSVKRTQHPPIVFASQKKLAATAIEEKARATKAVSFMVINYTEALGGWKCALVLAGVG